MAQSKKKRQNKKKEVVKKPYDPLENCSQQPFEEHRPYLKEAHDVGHLIWLLNNGKLTLPYHEHRQGSLNFNLPFDNIEKSYYNTNPNLVILDDFLNEEALQKLRSYNIYIYSSMVGALVIDDIKLNKWLYNKSNFLST